MFNENSIKSTSNYTRDECGAQLWAAWKPWQPSLFTLTLQKWRSRCQAGSAAANLPSSSNSASEEVREDFLTPHFHSHVSLALRSCCLYLACPTKVWWKECCFLLFGWLYKQPDRCQPSQLRLRFSASSVFSVFLFRHGDMWHKMRWGLWDGCLLTEHTNGTCFH